MSSRESRARTDAPLLPATLRLGAVPFLAFAFRFPGIPLLGFSVNREKPLPRIGAHSSTTLIDIFVAWRHT